MYALSVITLFINRLHATSTTLRLDGHCCRWHKDVGW